jgi:hypothetical protein
MKYQSLHTILKYHFNIPNLINIGISYRNGMLKRYLRLVFYTVFGMKYQFNFIWDSFYPTKIERLF